MKKLRLSLEDLAVESFQPETGRYRSGTVRLYLSGDVTDECDSCGSWCGGCEQTPECPQGSRLQDTCSCAGWYTCAGVYTCDGDTCQWPACTQDPQNVC